MCPEGDSDADLTPPLRDNQRHRAVCADDAQKQCKYARNSGSVSENSIGQQISGEPIVQRMKIVGKQIGIDLRHFGLYKRSSQHWLSNGPDHNRVWGQVPPLSYGAI